MDDPDDESHATQSENEEHEQHSERVGDIMDGNVESSDAIERIRLDDGSGIIMAMIKNKEDPREDKRRMNTIASNECNGEYTDLDYKAIELGLSVLYNKPEFIQTYPVRSACVWLVLEDEIRLCNWKW
ncbi:unnamed protein product [Albugo candida]|uniref:Uncharacterized protein n=1 Tax=Albugo candida TaxID=65357 RepID=A0A024GQU2_9STRA|nr:unnamed protein product [Albugo candida]|eukprot:CCI48728.1 unnamed protein product [Albugo candida]